MTEINSRASKTFIIGASIAIPLLVSLLYLLPEPSNVDPELRKMLNNLPLFNALINGTTFFILIGALLAIKNKKIGLHKALMTMALIFSALFLLSYVAFHLTTPSTKFGGEGTIKIIYLVILLTHIVLSAVVVPLVLISYVRGLSQKFDKHRKIARITLPIWLYVALTGVLVYLMISPYYSFNL